MSIMTQFIEQHREEIEELCRKYRVHKMEVFGSAANGDFDPATSDVDFIVTFQELEPLLYGDMYFGLLESLETLLNRKVDLLTGPSKRNPYFLKGIANSRTLIYAGQARVN